MDEVCAVWTNTEALDKNPVRARVENPTTAYRFVPRLESNPPLSKTHTLWLSRRVKIPEECDFGSICFISVAWLVVLQ